MSIPQVSFFLPPLGKERKECAVNPFIRLNGKQVYSILTSTRDLVAHYTYPTRREYTVLSHPALPFHQFIGTVPCPSILRNSDLEIIPDSADSQELNQIRESDARYFLQLYDAIAQDKTCLLIQGTPEFREAVLKDIQTLLTRPGGRQLIGTLCCTLNNASVMITEEEKNLKMKFDDDPNFYLTLNYNDLGIGVCRDQRGEIHFVPNPRYIALAHECIHILHEAAQMENPNSLPSCEVLHEPCNRLFKNLSEKLTICGLANPVILCENTLRSEFGLLPRIAHKSSRFLDFTPQDLPNIDTPNQDDVTRIENAAFFRAYAEIRKLLTAGAKPGDGFLKAIYYQDQELIRFLLQEGASPYKLDRLGNLPLHLAAKWNCQEIVKLFIDHGVRIDEKDPRGQTPLQIALQNKSFQSALLLIHRGAPFTLEALEFIPNEPGLREEFVKHVPPHLNFSKVKIIPIKKGNGAIGGRDRQPVNFQE